MSSMNHIAKRDEDVKVIGKSEIEKLAMSITPVDLDEINDWEFGKE